MERALFAVRLFPGTELEYDRRHTNVWAELIAEIRSSGIYKLSAFRRGTDCWWYGECEPDAASAFAALASQTSWRNWIDFDLRRDPGGHHRPRRQPAPVRRGVPQREPTRRSVPAGNVQPRGRSCANP